MGCRKTLFIRVASANTEHTNAGRLRGSEETRGATKRRRVPSSKVVPDRTNSELAAGGDGKEVA
jgi:hypothetical protein